MVEALAVEMGQNKIKELLDQRKMSIYRLAKDTGISYQTLHALTKAGEIPGGTTYDTLKKIAHALGVSVSDLDAGQDEAE
jgi:DNA-binding Xre family transcriptional regulator